MTWTLGIRNRFNILVNYESILTMPPKYLFLLKTDIAGWFYITLFGITARGGF